MGEGLKRIFNAIRNQKMKLDYNPKLMGEDSESGFWWVKRVNAECPEDLDWCDTRSAAKRLVKRRFGAEGLRHE